MCELPKRRLRSSLNPVRLVTALLALGAVVAGWLVPGLLSAIPVGAGLLTLAAAVLMPAIKEVEFGLSPNIKLSPALKDREAELRSVFERQKGDMEYCAHLLCDDPDTARQLLEAAWSQATTAWKGPVTPQLRVYTLCVLVQMLRKREQWLRPRGGARGEMESGRVGGSPDASPLAGLPQQERAVVVLHEFANLTIAEIAGMTGDAPAVVGKTLAHARAMSAGLSLEEGRP